MNAKDNIELLRVRLRFVDLIKSFFLEEPDAEKMSRWRGFFTAVSKEQVNPSLDKAVKELRDHINRKKLDELQVEYYKLFVDPYDPDRLQLDASYHMDGRSYGVTLANFRGFLQESNLEKDTSYNDVEDSLIVMIDVLGTLVEQEKKHFEIARLSQATLLEVYLEPLVKRLIDSLGSNETADFYRSCLRFVCGYLDLEKGLVG